MKKRILATTLILAMCLSLAPVAMAAEVANYTATELVMGKYTLLTR